MKRFFVGILVTLLTLIATAGAASACSYYFYEPELPAKLRK